MSVFYNEKSVRKETAHLCSCYFYVANLICRKAAVDGYFISPRYNKEIHAMLNREVLQKERLMDAISDYLDGFTESVVIKNG